MSFRLNHVLTPVIATIILSSQVTTAQQADVSTVLAAARTAMIGGSVSLQDITLTGDVDYITGSTTEHGKITMTALVDGSARFDVTLKDRTFSESVFIKDSRIQGQRKNAAGEVHPLAAHNVMVDAAWFCPALLVLRYEKAAQLGYVSGGASVEHHGQPAVRLTSALEAKTPHEPTNAELRRLSRTDLFLDPASFQPLAFTHETHPANDSLINVAVEARYSAYQSFNGVSVPMHIQRYVNGALNMDIHLTAAQINTGLSAPTFHLQ